MNKQLLTGLILSLQFLFGGNVLTEKNQKYPKNIQVLLEKDADTVLLEVKGPYYIFNPYDRSRISSGLMGKRFLVRSTQNGIKWGEEFPGIHQIYIVPRSNDTSILINGIQYDGSIAVYKNESKIHVINDLSIESFIKAQLTNEFNYPYENEVMAAVAIAARTTAYYYINKNPTGLWHLNAKEVNYQGCALIEPDSFSSKAVDETKNLVLMRNIQGKNNPFVAYWTEHSAGKTAPFHTIFRKDGKAPLIGCEAPHALLDKKESEWNFNINKAEFEKLFYLNNITAIETFADKNSEKVYAFRIKDAKGIKDIPYFEMQNRLGKEHIQSNDLKVNLINQQVSFKGFGKGHGVGICLYTASAMAQNGDIAIKILNKFFPQAFLMNLSVVNE